MSKVKFDVLKLNNFYIKITLLSLFLFLIFLSLKNFYPFFFLLNLILLTQLFFFKSKKLSNIFLVLLSIIITIIILEFFLSFFVKEQLNPGFYNKKIGSMYNYNNLKIGYNISDGVYNFKFYIKENNLNKELFENQYVIKQNMRVKEQSYNLNQCPKYILLGGSHNFGQALNFDDTLQGMLQKKENIINLSVPGYGLNHSIWRLDSEENYIKKVCNDDSEKIFIYRYMFMNGHLLRNIGLHSYNKNDPDFRKNKLESYLNNLKNDKLDIKTYCYKLNSCLSYNLNYFLYRIISTFIYSKSYTGKIIGENLKKIFFNNNKMVSHSINLSNLLEKYISSIYPNSKIIIYVEDISYKKSKEPYKYLKKNIQKDKITSFYSSEIKKNKNIIVVRTTEVPKIKDCLELYIPYEGHPSKCQNKKISEYILNLN